MSRIMKYELYDRSNYRYINKKNNKNNKQNNSKKHDINNENNNTHYNIKKPMYLYIRGKKYDLSEKYSNVDEKLRQYYYGYVNDCHGKQIYINKSGTTHIDLSLYRNTSNFNEKKNYILFIDETKKTIKRLHFNNNNQKNELKYYLNKHKTCINNILKQLKENYTCHFCNCFVGVNNLNKKSNYCSYMCRICDV